MFNGRTDSPDPQLAALAKHSSVPGLADALQRPAGACFYRCALQVNPYDKRGMAQALQTALNMPLDERQEWHGQMLAAVRRHDIHNWYGSFVHDLTGERLRLSSIWPGTGRAEPDSAARRQKA